MKGLAKKTENLRKPVEDDHGVERVGAGVGADKDAVVDVGITEGCKTGYTKHISSPPPPPPPPSGEERVTTPSVKAANDVDDVGDIGDVGDVDDVDDIGDLRSLESRLQISVTF